MTNIIEFPTRSVQNWVASEHGMREVLRTAGAPPEMIEEVCKRMRPVFKRLQFTFAATLKFPMPASATPEEITTAADAVKAVCRDLERQIREFSMRVMLERLSTETELYVARHRIDRKGARDRR